MKCWIHTATAVGVASLVLAWPMSAQAQTAAADLPSTEQALAAIDQDPAVLQARRAVQVATHSAAMRAAGPYEWTVGATGQRRRIDGSGSTTEWSAQIERLTVKP